MRALLLPLGALTVAVSGCGARTDLGLTSLGLTPPALDGASTQTSSATGAGTTETARATASETMGTSSSSPMSSFTGETTSTGTATFTGPDSSTTTALATSTDAASCMIEATNYDQLCAIDDDCAQVVTGDYCGGECPCAWAAISATALPAFNADVAKTPVGSGAVRPEPCNCPASSGPCCQDAICTTTCQ